VKVGVVGLGYVGLPLAVTFAEAGVQVVAVDNDQQRVEAVTNGSSFIEDISDARMQGSQSLITATTEYSELSTVDAVLLCVPTPLSVNREPDLSYLVAATESLSQHIKAGQLVVLESTTYPGTTRDEVLPILQRSGLSAGSDFNLAFSPERVDPGQTNYTLKNTPKVIGGLTEDCTVAAVELYKHVCDEVVTVSSLEVAELSKLLENIFRSVNIALVNELAMIAHRMDIDIWEVIDAAATKPFGFTRFDPGPGMGGHCLPVDPFYLAWKAREYDQTTEFIELAGKVNKQMPYFCIERIESALNTDGRPVNGSKVLLLGVAYKPGVGDTRESPALKLIELLKQRGGVVKYHDPHVPALKQFELASTDLSEGLKQTDLVVIVTAHSEIDYNQIMQSGAPVLDLRGVTRGLQSTARTEQL